MELTDFLFPKKCVGCGKGGRYVCSECEVGMWEEEQICPGCRRASRYGLLHLNCKSPLSGLTCLWAYEGLVKKIIKKIKYGGFYDFLSELLATSGQLSARPEFYFFEKFISQKPMVVPVPLHANRLRRRGFNQSAIIADLVFGRRLSVVKDLLIRVKDTEQQVGKKREDRLNAMQEAFKINNKCQVINIKSVLLVDDVWTTGATMTEAAKVLVESLPAGRQVWGFVLAR